jgi:hypothetical protein
METATAFASAKWSFKMSNTFVIQCFTLGFVTVDARCSNRPKSFA